MPRILVSIVGSLLVSPGILLAQEPALSPYVVPSTFTVPPPATCAAPLASVVAVPPSRPCSLAALTPTPPSEPPPLVRIDPAHRRFDPAAVQGLLRMGLCAATQGSC